MAFPRRWLDVTRARVVPSSMPESASEIFRDGFGEFREFVNPLIAERARLAREPIQFVAVKDGVLHDRDDQAYEDFHGTQMLGHRNRVVADAIRGFLDSDRPNWFPSRVNPWAGRLARRLCERTGYSNAFFGMSGADAVEAALKLARAATGKPRIIALTGGYHGCTFGAVAMMHAGPLRDPFGPHLPGVDKVAFDDVAGLTAAMAAGDVCAVVVEPIQGEGGVRALSPEMIAAACALTSQHGALLVADEVQTALGRSGHFLASAGWPRQPDVALLAKTLGGGLVPISVMLTHRAIFERAYGQNFFIGESHNTTFGYNGLSCVAALATLDLLTDELIADVARRGVEFRARLTEALATCPLFVETRGAGFMIGVQLRQPSHPWLSFEHFGMPELAHLPTIGPLLCYRLYRRGFFAFVCGHDWSILRLQPRFDIPDERLAAFATACREELDVLDQLS
ncbi:MAG: aspartate aminotransferase family protein [Myxococcales bacterium]|nr:aspartate aminotransferase family protein [Myxococcales bacterium]